MKNFMLNIGIPYRFESIQSISKQQVLSLVEQVC